MDPISVITIIETCAGLTVTAGKLAVGLRTLGAQHRQAPLTFRSLASQCRLFACAVRAIQQWIEEHGQDTGATQPVDNLVWEQLLDSLECANDSIYALQTELAGTSGEEVNSFWERSRLVWNVPALTGLETCLQRQCASLTLILQIIQMPTPARQVMEMQTKQATFNDSRSSARCLRDPGASTLGSIATVRQGSMQPSLAHSLAQMQSFDFDDILMASQVYLRNRNHTLALKSAAPIRNDEQMKLVREIERLLEDRRKSHDWTKEALESQQQESTRAYADRIEKLEADYQSAVSYVKGAEKMLQHMKEEMFKSAAKAQELQSQLEHSNERQEESDRAYESRVEQLQSDYQSAVSYVKGAEKVLRHMKEEMFKSAAKA